MSQNPASTSQPAAADVPAVELIGITKRFPGVVANDDVSLAVRHGEVHCLLGENGAGKSTLMSILSGMLSPDAGRIRIDGREVRIDAPQRALELGIGMVYQHSMLIPALTVLENLMLGESRGLRLPIEEARRRFEELSATLGVQIEPRTVTADLALGQQQQVEIIKALWRGSRVLILDEPTSMLTPQGVADLQKVLVRLKESGVACIFITHKLHEALAIGDRVSILKQGRVAGTIDEQTMHTRSHHELQSMIVRMMFGDEARAVSGVAELEDETVGHRARHVPDAPPLLELDGVSARGEGHGTGIHGISLAIRPGEIVGIAGVDGNGQRELADAIAGQIGLTGGEIRFEGRAINRLSVAARQALGIRYITDDRLGEGIVPSLSVALNLVLKQIGREPFWRRGQIQMGAINRGARELVGRFDVRTPGVGARIGTLSGGNIQKVLLARDLASEPRVVIFHKPTQGLDIKTTRWVRQLIRTQAEAGVSTLVISTDLDEILELCDRVGVLFRGRLAGIVENGPDAARRIGELMIGGQAA